MTYTGRNDGGSRREGKRPYGDKRGERLEKGYSDKRGERSEKGYSEKREKRDFAEKPAYKKRDYAERPSYEKRERPITPPVQPEIAQAEDDEQPYLLIGRNAVREAIRADRSIDRILVSTETDGSLREIVSLARDKKLVIREVDRRKLDELCMPFGHGGKTANHQGIVAYAAGVEYCEVKDILAVAKERNEAPFVIVLDGIEDPHNLGSILRSADCAGAHGVVIGKRRSAQVSAAAVKASAGASEYLKVARVVNIARAVEELKEAGLWVAGADMRGEPMTKQNLAGALALVIGSEGDGISKLVRDKCDYLVSIPMRGHIDSLNAGVAAGILMFEKRRQDEA